MLNFQKNVPNGIVSSEEIWYNEHIPFGRERLPAVFRGVRMTRRVASSSLVSSLTRNEKGQIETLQEHHQDASLKNAPSFPVV